MTAKAFIFIILILTSLDSAHANPVFTFYLKSEPKNLDPALMTAGEPTYLYSQLFRGLTRFTGKNGLIFDQAKKCVFKEETIILCELRQQAKWNDGQPVRAEDFVRGFARHVSPGSRSSVAHLLFGVKNAKDVYAGRKPISLLGLKALPDGRLEIDLEERDTEFLEKLSNPLLSPYREPASQKLLMSLPTNGPYQIEKLTKNQSLELKSFNDYFGGTPSRPDVKIIYSSDDAAALLLYEKGVINFLWGLNSINIPKFKDRPDFIQIPQARFDYLGFNLRPGQVFENKDLRRRFAESVNFDAFKKIFFALGAPGCPGLQDPFLNSEEHCQEFNPRGEKLTLPKSANITLMFSQSGGDDIKGSAKFFQGQWQEHLGVRVALRQMEQKKYLSLLQTAAPPIFHKGVMLDWPGCQGALEVFLEENGEDYTGFHNERFKNLVKALSNRKQTLSERESICGVASDILFKEEFVGIPLGQIHFTLLVDPHFQGWKLNELNQLDLSQLTYK